MGKLTNIFILVNLVFFYFLDIFSPSNQPPGTAGMFAGPNPYVIEWIKEYGGQLTDEGIVVRTTPDGGYLVGGVTNSFDRDVAEGYGLDDYWVLRLDADGELIWETALGGSESDYFFDLKYTPDGGCIVIGASESSDDLVDENFGLEDYWVVKLNAQGNIEWKKNYGGSGGDRPFSVLVLPNDRGYIIGGRSTSDDGDLPSVGLGRGEAWLLRIDNNGTILNSVAYGGAGFDAITEIIAMPDGNFIGVGKTSSTENDFEDFDSGARLFAFKFDLNFDIIWGRVYDPDRVGADRGASLFLKENGNLIVAGDWDDDPTTVEPTDSWVFEMNGNTGALIWSRTFGDPNIDDDVRDVVVGIDGQIVIIGMTDNQEASLPGSIGQKNIWLAGLDGTNGTVIWEEVYGGLSLDKGSGVSVTPQDEGLILTGLFTFPEVDPVIGKRLSEVWVMKMTPFGLCAPDDSLALVDLYRATGGPNWTNTWNLNQPMRTWYGVTLKVNGCVERLDLSNNNLIGIVPASINNLGQVSYINLSNNRLQGAFPDVSNLALTGLILNDNELEVIPDFTSSNTWERGSDLGVQVAGNRLTFEDLLPNRPVGPGATFVYAPQDSIFVDTTIRIAAGSDLTIDLLVDENINSNSYRWTKDGLLHLTQFGNNNLEFTNLQLSDSGDYYCQITNTQLPSLRLYSRRIRLIVECPEELVESTRASICEGDSFDFGGESLTTTGTYRDSTILPSGCLEIRALDLRVIPSRAIQIDTTLCPGDSLVVGAFTFTEPVQREIVLSTSAGCDSIIELNLQYHTPVTTRLEETICSGESFRIGNTTFTEAGRHTVVLQAANGCDSTVILDLSVGETYSQEINRTICEGDEITIGGQTFSSSGSFPIELTTQLGCDSLIQLNLTVDRPSVYNLDTTICFGEEVELAGQTFDRTDSYQIVTTNQAGCDSTINLNLTVRPRALLEIDTVICAGERLRIGNEVLTETGEYIIPLINALGCDSLVRVDLRVAENYQIELDTVLCDGGSLTVGNRTFDESGRYRIDLVTRDGCDSIIQLNLEINDPTVVSIDTTVCFGEEVRFGNETFQRTGNYDLSLVKSNGCDSIVNLNLTVRPRAIFEVDTLICEGSSVLIGGQEFDQPGEYEIRLTNAFGCDSLIRLKVDLGGKFQVRVDTAICRGESVTIAGETFDRTGIYTLERLSQDGCDSVIQVSLTVNRPTIYQVDTTLCFGEQIELGEQVFDSTGVYELNLQNRNGCDSTIFLNLVVRERAFTTIDTVLCAGASLTVGDEVFTGSGNYTVRLTNEFGCDSTVRIELVVADTFFQQLDTAICRGEQITVGNRQFTETGNYTVRMLSRSGCDSTIQLNLNVLENSSSTIDTILCFGEQLSLEGQVFDSTGSYTIQLLNRVGCDSTIFLNLTVLPQTLTEIDTVICEGEAVALAGQTFAATGNYEIVLSDRNGCDSLILLDLLVAEPFFQQIDTTICLGEVVSLGADTFTVSGEYTLNYTSRFGCDSTILLNLQVFENTEATLDTAICFGETLPLLGEVFDQTGNYELHLLNRQGCDSTIFLNLLVRPQAIAIIDTVLCSGENIFIGDQVFNQTGNYEVFLTNAYGCDSTVQLELIVGESYFKQIDSVICAGERVRIGNEEFTETGNYTIAYQTELGCDSIINLDLIVHPNTENFITATVCFGDSITVAGQTFDRTGIFELRLTNQAGCDSTIILDLTVLEELRSAQTQLICRGESVVIGTQQFAETGDYEVVLQNQNGCDSTVSLSLQVAETYSVPIDTTLCPGGTIQVGNQLFARSGQFTIPLQTRLGCDSTILLNLKVLEVVELGAAEAGDDTTVCTPDYRLLGNLPPNTTGIWSAVNSQAVIMTPNQSTTDIMELDEGANEFRWTLSTAKCQSYSSDGLVIIRKSELPIAQNDSTVLEEFQEVSVNINIIENDIFELDELSQWNVELIRPPKYGNAQFVRNGVIEYTTEQLFLNDTLAYRLFDALCPNIRFDEGELIIKPPPPSRIRRIGITPDGNGLNERLIIVELENDPTAYPDNELVVFNRWGDIVFRQRNYDNQWQGTYKGTSKPLPEGSYYFRMVLNAGLGEIIEGEVAIIRRQ